MHQPRPISLVMAAATVGLGALSIPLSDLGRTFCPFAVLTGTACPGCGLTRSIASLVRGDLSGSLAMHPFGILLAFQGIVFMALEIAGFRFSSRKWRIPLVLAVNLVGLLALWILRWSNGALPPV